MDSKNRNLSAACEDIPNNDNAAKNLLKLDQLPEFGLDFFSEDAKFDEDLKDETLQSMLLNDESQSSLTSSSGNVGRVGLSTFNDYVSSDMMPSLSPEHRDAQVIEVFPLTENMLTATGIDGEENKGPLFSSAANLIGSEDFSIPTLKTHKELSSSKKKPSARVGRPVGKKIKIRRLACKPDLKIEMPLELDFSDIEKPIKNGFDEDSMNEEHVFNDNTELENKINDTLLDMLQEKMGPSHLPPTNCFSNSERKIGRGSLKFITIAPPYPDGKTINLMVKGRTCRSKQPLTNAEQRIVTKILNNENTCVRSAGERSYKNVYYDSESDSNIRYEVKYESASEESFGSSLGINAKNKKSRTRTEQLTDGGPSSSSGNKEGYVVNSVARTRCGRISRPPRHVIRDYKRLKHLNESKNDVEDENENSGGYADYRPNDESHSSAPVKEKEKQPGNLYGPLEPNKRQFSSLSLCPTCGKVYLGYRRMAIHFQKYPEHTNEELLRRLLSSAKKKAVDENGISAGLADINDEVLGDVETGTLSSPHSNGIPKKKGRMCRRFRMRGLKNGTFNLKQLLSTCRVDDVIKYAAPVVAGVLGSWEYLLMRSKQLRTDNESLVAALLTELSVVLRQIRSLSDTLLKPCAEVKGSQPCTRRFKIEDEDVLQHVLGVAPGTYVVSENEDWARNSSQRSDKADEIDSAEPSSPLKSSRLHENLVDELDKRTKSSNDAATAVDSFYKLSDPVIDLVHDIEKDLDVSPGAVSGSNPEMYGDESNFDSDRQNRLFGSLNHVDLKDGLVASIQLSDGTQFDSKHPTNAGSLGTSRLDYVAQSFSPSHSLSFDSLVGSVDADDDIINDFPISLPMLSDNSTDSKDCLDLLNSLKSMDNAADSVMAELRNVISSNLPAPSRSCDGNARSFESVAENDNASRIMDFTSINPNFP